jgi:hypothetical protein
LPEVGPILAKDELNDYSPDEYYIPQMEQLAIEALESFTILGPGGRQISRPDLVQYISPAISHGAMNTVVRTRFSTKELDRKIAETLAPYQELSFPSWWILGPNSTNNKETEARLSKLGFSLEHEAFCLMLPVNEPMKLKISSRVSTERVTEKNLDDFLKAARDGQEVPAAYRKYFEFIMEKHGSKLEVFLSRVDGEPAGTGLLQHLNGAANFVSGFVREKFRGLGAYQALVQIRLESLRQQKIAHAVVLSKAKTSAPILMQNGFIKICEMRTLERLTLQKNF